MSVAAVWIALAAVLALLAGLLLMLVGRTMRLLRGLSGGKTVSPDRVTLTSHRLGLTGRPDRLIKADGAINIEEWKSAVALRPWHRAQMGVYFLLVEEQLGFGRRMASSTWATARGTTSTILAICGPGSSTWPGRYERRGQRSRGRFRSNRNPDSAAHAGCAGIAGRRIWTLLDHRLADCDWMGVFAVGV
jgi:hypothetical protein